MASRMIIPDEHLEEIVLKRLKIMVGSQIGQSVLAAARVDIARDVIDDDLFIKLQTYLLAEELEAQTVEYGGDTVKRTYLFPSTWWQHFKQDYFPDWLLGGFPMQYEHKVMYARTEKKKLTMKYMATYPRANVVMPALGMPVIKYMQQTDLVEHAFKDRKSTRLNSS